VAVLAWILSAVGLPTVVPVIVTVIVAVIIGVGRLRRRTDSREGVHIRWRERFALRMARFGENEMGCQPYPLSLCEQVGYTADGSMWHVGYVRHRGMITGILRMRGFTVGITSDDLEEGAAARFGSFLSLCTSQVPAVDQVTISTVWDPAVMDGVPAGPLSAIVSEQMPTMASEPTYYLAVTMREVECSQRSHADVAEPVLDGAYRVLSHVAALADSYGFQVLGVVAAEDVGTVMARYYGAPMMEWESENPWESMPQIEDHTDCLECTFPDGTTWWTAGGYVPADGWPSMTVPAGWLQSLVVGCDAAPWRIFTIGFRLIRQQDAIEKMRVATAHAMSESNRASKEGIVTAGDENRRMNAAMQSLTDLSRGASGVALTFRAVVTAPTYEGVVSAKDSIESALRRFLGLDWTWCDQDHGRGVAAAMPVGVSIPKVSRR
jgi:hypothetical protein